MLIKKIACCHAIAPTLTPTLTLGCFVIACCLSLPAQADKLSPLDKIHQAIVSQYSNVSHVTAVSDTQSSTKNIVLIDVREPDEYAVSHIKGAVRVSPDISPDTFLARFSEGAEDKTYIFYCSVGRRSSALINRVQAGLLSEGAASISNLEGGLFKWHNDSNALVNQSGKTKWVHPYNFFWKRLLERPNESSYTPN